MRFPEAYRSDIEDLEGILVPGGGGAKIPLGRLAIISLAEGPAQVGREKGMRRVAAEVNIRGRDLGGFVAEVKGKLAALEKELPPGYFLEYGGQFENRETRERRCEPAG